MIISHLTEENNEEPKRKEISEEENVISLSKRDLVILYENTDNTKQTNLENRSDRRTPNQHVETVVYNGDLESEDSDIGEIYCNQDLYDVVLINKERLDILNSMPSLDKMLCQKFGDYNIETDLSVDYNGEFLYKNNFVQEQLNSLSNVSNFDSFGGTFLSTSLLDYIFSNRFDDNSNFYMDNVIQFVNRTIDQLKRISNGDYLTDKAREKWKWLERERKSDQVNKIAKVVVKTKSNPFHVEGNVTSLKNTWRDIVCSELDIKVLSKILRKKVVVEIPRIIYGTYQLFSKDSDVNFIICCKKIFRKPKSKVDKKSRIDIVVQLRLPDSQNVGADIDAVTILQKVLPRNESWYPLQYNYLESTKSIDNTLQNELTTVELKEQEVEQNICSLENELSSPMHKLHIKHEYEETTNTENSVLCTSKISSQATDQILNCCNKIVKHTGNEEKESNTQSSISDIISSSVDDLFCSIQKFNTHATLLEENEDFPSIRKKSPTKVRIKSPYENKSFFIEERKIKKLLEIRERRERRKKAHSENCKGKKYKYGKGAVMAQPSSSVTKLSITNKSFYNSIYGESANINKKYVKNQSQKGSSEILSESSVEKPIMKFAALKVDEDFFNDGEKDNIIKDFCISPNCAKNNDFSMDFNSFTFHDVPCATNLRPTNSLIRKEKHNESSMSVRLHNTTPASIINSNDSDKSFTKKSLISLECKKSIDKIYELMKKLSKVDSSDSSSSKCDFSLSNESNMHLLNGKSLTIQISDSGTSLKHQLTSSNPSIYSLEETNNTAEFPTLKKGTINTTRTEVNVIPKVVISSKSHIRKLDKNESKSVKKVTINIPENIPKNPLKAISHLINEFDHIQKNNQGTITEAIENKKAMNGVFDGKSLTRYKKVSRYENQAKVVSNKIVIPNDRKTQSKLSVNRGKIINQQISINDRNVEKRNKITDIVDEALREARGEAVRGPSKPYTRLDSLSQPKRLNINTQNEGVKFRHGKNTVPDKLSHLKYAAPQISEKPAVSTSTFTKFRPKRNEQENVTTLNSKSPHYLTTTEKPTRQKRTINNFPIENTIPPINTTSYKQRKVPENSRQFKKAIPIESLNLKKYNRQLTLTQTAASSNLLQKPNKSQTTPAPNFSQQGRDATFIGISSSLVSQEPTEIKLSVCNDIDRNGSVKTPTLFNEANSYIMSKNLSKDEELVSICSDYGVADILEDKDVLTAVSSIPTRNKRNEQIKEETHDNEKLDKLVSNTVIPEHDTISDGIKHLEKALYQQMSEGVFQKRLKIKNLTLTPKPSTHQVFLLQCGDANSLLVKSCMTQNVYPNGQIRDKLCDKVQLSKISKSYLDWSNLNIPINVATIGYSFPKFKSIKCGSNTQIKFIDSGKSSFQLTNKELKNSNHEKAVQTLQSDKGGIRIDAGISTAGLTKTTERIIYSCTDSSELLINTKRNGQFDTIKATNENDNVTNTTSLDILADLLDEIENIAKYQSLKASDEDKTETKQPCNPSADPNCYGPHEFTSFCLNRNCITSKNQSNTFESELMRNFDDDLGNVTQKILKIADIIEPKYFDKEVTVTIYKECTNAFTDVPSQLSIPKEEHRNTLKSFTGTVSEPSNHSLVSLYDYRTLYLNKIKDMPYIQSFNQPKQSDDPMENYGQLADRKGNDDSVYHKNQKDFNSMLRIKRDILVTIYSILVFTVFAALSLSEFIY